ncbi:MAG: type II toxin-antitoxin system HicA family toxin [Candidatus Nealsonbacteria bacterium DGGOD1a]|jgi:Predicted periplasmic or secreted lipoprotein|nr:MAG: type II toxin-antitoxin system HicA family toxin [Candidatus Nealsonbacteria bacterium DGGOD1a]
MAKLPAITPKKLISILEKSGFAVSRVSGSHVILNRPTDKRRIIVPCHTKDLPKGTLMSILHEAGIDKDQLKDLV